MRELQDNPQVEALALEYIGALDAGNRPDLDAFTARLADPVDREQLRDLVSTVQWAEGTFPTPFKPMTVVAGRYLLLDELGCGGFGKVWRAEDQQLKRLVAIKLFHPLLDDAHLESSLRRERQALARVTHDGIVRLLDQGRHDGAHFLVMEYVKGRALERVTEALAALPAGSRLDRAAVSAAIGAAPAGDTGLIDDDWYRTAAHITCQMLWALAAAHSAGVVHRDLKPGNVLLRPGGRPVLLDFGLAGIGENTDGSLTARLFGTAAYVAPEQLARNYTGKDVRVDIYQCGLLLYEMLTLKRAFDEGKQTLLLEAVRQGRVTPPQNVRRDVPAALADVCLRAIERDPGRRYATADAFRNDLEIWLAGQVPGAARLGGVGRGLRRVRVFAITRRSFLVAAALVLAGGGTSTWLWLRPPPFHYSVVGQTATVEASMARLVTAWARFITPAGTVAESYQVKLIVGDAEPTVLLTVAPGATTLQIVDSQQVPAGMRVSYKLLDDSLDYQSDRGAAADAVAMAVREEGGPLTRQRFEAVNNEITSAGRGGQHPVRPLPIDEIFKP